ncbi:Adaptor protein complex [Macleaya cordata]|uniref:Adaptor protein complex n=1 Tax=Macleaya cordata TaxID=56857 RepID=A0A200QPR4_MACCD|nr:Adaptor protein complex [Macleaya cordata]
MGIRFILLVNKQGQTRLAQYYEYLTIEQRRALEGEIVRKCLARTEQQTPVVLKEERGKKKKMGIRFILLVNKQGQTRLAQYYEYLTIEQRRALEGEIVRKCLARTEQQVSSLFLSLDQSLDRAC